jgi:hypothetical protein
VTAKGIIVSVFVFVLGAAAFAGEEHRMLVELGVDEHGQEAEIFRFDRDDPGMSLHDMQVGESRTLTDDSGTTALVVRTEDGFEFDINGRKFRMGNVIGGHGVATIRGTRASDFLVNAGQGVHAASSVRIVDGGTGDRVTIISGSALDETTKQQIRDVLASTGQTGDVTFIDPNSSHGDHGRVERVHIITNEVDVTD